ncbi:DUF3013 family protein [Carnobacterium funditum]|uniref:DUF3013 family protein n=1 Tax=Carnobacterium funditum TaxID=2752 RepID=UPI000556BF71|nr:DUF3013 family protein [Carnobacterium funditum]
MTKHDMIDYLESTMSEANLDFDWSIEWKKRQNVIEVTFTLYAETEPELVIQDIEGTVNTENIIQFEDVVCFYNPEKSKIILDDYLAAFPFDFKKGIEKGFIDAFVKMLRIVVTEGQSDLLDFATDSTIETFEIEWNQVNFEQTIQTFKDTNRYNLERVEYPKF